MGSRTSYAAHLIQFRPNIVEGSLRENKKDYLHFLYIARGSLSEVQYFVHLAWRLDYLSAEESEALREQTKMTFVCLHGLIRAVEKEAEKLSKALATVTSLLVIGLMRWSSGQLSVVS
jgi:23S rRNA-intervening sequence protein